MLDTSRGIRLKVIINKPDIIYTPGDTIEGTVLIETTKTINCKSLTVYNGFKVYGKGNSDSRQLLPCVKLFKGEWQLGRYRYPFKVKIPYQGTATANESTQKVPATFHGHYVNVSWFITAIADVTWRQNLKAEASYKLANPTVYLKRLDINVNEISMEILSYLFMALLFGIFILSGGLMTIIGVKDKSLKDILLGIIFLVLPSILAYFTIGHYLSLRNFGVVNLVVNGGQDISVIDAKLSITAKKYIMLDKLTAYLIFEESATSGSGTSATTYHDTKIISNYVVPRSSNIALHQNRTKSFDIHLQIPEPLIPTLYLEDNQIAYKVKIVARANNKDHKWEQEIFVV